MTTAVDWPRAERTRRAGESLSGNGTRLFRCDYFGPEGDFYGMTREDRVALYERLLDGEPAPHAFMIQQSPDSEIPAHFHRVPQYQVMVHGSGRLGRNAVEEVAFHYTDAYTAYGPILSGGEGLWYCTLRAYFDPGANYVRSPESRAVLRPSRKRFILVGPEKVRAGSDTDLAARRTTALDCVIEPEDDGVAAWMWRLPAGGAGRSPDPAAGGGQYLLVLRGEVEHDGRHCPRHSLIWVGPRDQPAHVVAGARGAECAVLQFPRGAGVRRPGSPD